MIASENSSKAKPNVVAKNIKKTAKPNSAEMNAVTTLFNKGRLAESELLASKITQRFPQDGFGWKVLGAIHQQQGSIDKAFHALQMAAELLPNDSEAHYNLANCFYDKNQLKEAASSYQKAININPRFSQAHYNLGSVLKDQGIFTEAEVSYKNALKIDPDSAPMHFNLALMLYEQGRFSDAVNYYRQTLNLQAEFTAAHVNLGACLKALGQLREAEACYREALRIDPEHADAYNNLGVVLKELGDVADAEQCYRTAISINPDYASAYNNLGILLKDAGQMADAESCYLKALKIDPLRSVSHNNLAVLLRDQGRLADSEVCCRNALKITPDYVDAFNNLGLALDSQGRLPEAEAAFEQALEYDPHSISVLSNFSVTLNTLSQLTRAEIYLKKALELAPQFINAHINLCVNYLAQGRIQEAEEICIRALQIQPDSMGAQNNLLFSMNYSANYSAADCLEKARQYGLVVSSKVDAPFTSWQHKPQAKRLRVGLVSGDLRQHVVAYFLENFVQHLDTSSIELIAYPTISHEDEVTARLKPYFSGWKSLVGLTDQAAAQLIHNDGLHVLLDLSGHSAGNRLPIFAWKPAPLQASWLGYFATTGMAAMDYFIADVVGVPELNRAQFVEKIKYLPETRLCFTAPQADVAVSSLPALTNKFITFGCFQNMAKVGDEVLDLWAEVMRALPDAKLRCQCKSFRDSSVADELKQRLLKRGISSDRIILLGSVSRDAYLTAHHEVDVILDTFPFTGGTTTCEALWMGVPTLTLAGSTLIARQGASLLTAAGLCDWVAESKSNYLSKALLFCSDLNKLAYLRAGLRDRVLASALFDAPRFAKNMENALWEMWNDSQGTHFQPIHHQAQGKTVALPGDDKKLDASSKLIVEVVSATRCSEQEFWSKSALGLSLKRHLKQDDRLRVKIAFENSRGLSEIFNECIDQADDAAALVFIHDDVWIDEANFVDTVINGLENFDVIGIAGNVRRLPNQPGWAFIDHKFTWDDKANLSGRIAHSKTAFGTAEVFGAVPVECELLYGVFLATKKSSLNKNNVRFDAQFDFHFYDMDFCRSARKSGLILGTWLIHLTHQSLGDFGSKHWLEKCQSYLNKWEVPLANNNMIFSQDEVTQTQQLQQAMSDVLQMALQHQSAGDIKQAEHLYLEIIDIQPKHAEANHNLGVIEANLHGALVALPRLEVAIQAKPEVEQYWVSYIDALMQVGATDTVADALELGQKFGLRNEVAQMLASEYVALLDASAERLQVLQTSALEALRTEIKPRNKQQSRQVSHQKNVKPVFYIWSPNYTERSSGIKALHLLCDRLNGLGYEAYMAATAVNEHLRTPLASSDLIHRHKQESRLQIAIYPETQMGNPLLVPNVVRYLLNTPNFFQQTSWFGSFHKDERVLHFSSAITVPWVVSQRIRIQTVDRSIFKLPANTNTKRKGFLVYSHRAKPDFENIPEWCKPYQVISMENPKSPEQLATLYQQSMGLIVYERTMAVVEAMLCGCPVITCSLYGLEKSTSFYEGFDELLMSWDFDQDSYSYVKKIINTSHNIYESNEKVDADELVNEIGQIVTHFQSNEIDSFETTSSFVLETAKRYMQSNLVKDSIMCYRQLIADYPSNIEAYFRMSEALVKVGLLKPGLDILIKGESYLAELPKHKSLNVLRVMYYKNMSEVCQSLGDMTLKNKYIDYAKKYMQ